MKKVNFDVKLPAFVDRIVYVDNYGARPYCYTIEDASRNADAINRAINYISEKGGGTVVIPEGIWFTAPIEIKSDVELRIEKNAILKFSKDIVGENAKELSKELKPGKAILLENVRFDPREEKNDKEFSKELASLAEIYVNDAFGTAHRAHSSTVGVAEFLPAVCGFLIEKEVGMLGDNLNNPERPFVAILGGAKVSDKIKVIENLLEKVDSIIIGGGMTYTFLKAMGYEIGNSICELDRIDIA